ncbi:MAG TPA: LacI family DNA-binding transcriptional regulator [Candidatus Sulfotelmatobacter sp.]|nr:LacI family DNA-binding transcriptional regulator [Candidatus Sulfotelmatobacter sp.]
MSDKKNVVSLRTVAERVGLAPCSVSAVLNNTPASRSIPQRTKDRVLRAAAQLNYRPNYSARSLRTKRTHMVAVVSADFGHSPVARVVAAAERSLRRRGYLLVLGAFSSPSAWDSVSRDLQQRGIEAVIAIDASLPRELELPNVSIDLAYLTPGEPFVEGVGAWLTELGESAVKAVLEQIETKAAARQTKTAIAPRLPQQAYFNLPSTGLQAQSTAGAD